MNSAPEKASNQKLLIHLEHGGRGKRRESKEEEKPPDTVWETNSTGLGVSCRKTREANPH